jgi:hypothetical protein
LTLTRATSEFRGALPSHLEAFALPERRVRSRWGAAGGGANIFQYSVSNIVEAIACDLAPPSSDDLLLMANRVVRFTAGRAGGGRRVCVEYTPMPSKLATLGCALLTSGVFSLSSASAQLSTRPTTLKVTVLPTSFGLPDVTAPTYPATVNVEVPSQLQIAAYGAAGRVWLAPSSWTGAGSVGVDGNVFVNLTPTGGNSASGPRIAYMAMPACTSCILSRAAVYFPDALEQWNTNFNSDRKNPIARPADGLLLSRLGPHLVQYGLPSENGLPVRGAAFYDPSGDRFYEEVRLVLPETDERLVEFLVKYFADHIGLQ